MKYSLTILVFFLTSMVSMQSFSAEQARVADIIINTGDSDDCGLMETTNGTGGQVINPNDASICQQDVVGNSIYFLFGKIIEEIEILQDMLKTSDGVKETAIGLGVGDPIVSVLGTITTLVLMLGSLIITLTTLYGMLQSTGGEFLGKNWDTGKVIARVGVSITLMMPIAGGLSLIQISVLFVALLANIGGNYVTANFLNLVQVKSTQISSAKDDMLDLSVSQANNLISTELCVKRTNQKIFEDNYTSFDKDYEDESIFNVLSIEGLFGKDSLTVYDSLSRFDACLTPANIVEIEDFGGYFNFNDTRNKYISSFARGGIESCKNGTYAYDKAMYGEANVCGYTSYTYKNLDELDEDNADDTILDAVKSFRNDFSDYDEYSRVLQLEPVIRDVLDTDGSISFINPKPNSKSKDLYDQYIPIINSLKEKINKNLIAALESNSQLNENALVKYDAVFAYHQYVFNNLMGAYYTSSVAQREAGSRQPVKYYPKVKTERTSDIHSFAHKIIDDLALPAADFLEKSHCAKKWGDTKESRRTVRQLNNKLESMVEDIKSVSFECVSIDIQNADNKILSFNTIDNIYKNIDQDPNVVATEVSISKSIRNHKDMISPEAENEAKIKQQTLALWFYIVRTAILDNLSKEVKETTDELSPSLIRQQGWGGLGGYMLAISGNQKNANKMYQGILNNINWGQSISSGDVDYINEAAFKIKESDSVKEPYQNTFNYMNLDNFYTSTGKSVLNSMGMAESVDENNEGVIDIVLTKIERMLTYPMIYLEQASGINRNETDLTFREAIKECSSNGDCKIGETHPLNSLMQFGHELVSITTTIMLAELVFSKLSDVLSSEDEGKVEGGSGMKGLGVKLLSFLGPMKLLTMAVQFVAVVLEVLSPLTMTLLFVGILFAYIVPTIPYVAFTIVLINWLILIIELMIIMPIWITMFAITNEDGSGKTDIKMLWSFYGQLLLKPAFVVIALVVGWGISTISLYIINMTAFSSYIGSSLNNSSLIGLIDILMFYIIYVILAFVAIKQSFTVINTLPDTIFSRINIQSTGDNQMINELGVERMLQAAAIQNVISNIQGGIKDKVGEKSLKEQNAELKNQVSEYKNAFAEQEEERLSQEDSESTEKDEKK